MLKADRKFKRYKTYNQTKLQEAVNAVRCKHLSLRAAEKKYDIPRSTISDQASQVKYANSSMFMVLNIFVFPVLYFAMFKSENGQKNSLT